MSFNFVPDFRLNSFEEASAEFLKNIGVDGIVLDIDNTLEPYEHDLPGENVKAWLNSLAEVGIKAAIVSNNNRARVEAFNEALGLPAYFKAKKPFKKNVLRAMRDINGGVDSTVLMGDQIFTDVWAAHNAGLRAILVPPINDKKDIFTKLKRRLERPFLKKYEKRNKK